MSFQGITTLLPAYLSDCSDEGVVGGGGAIAEEAFMANVPTATALPRMLPRSQPPQLSKVSAELGVSAEEGGVGFAIHLDTLLTPQVPLQQPRPVGLEGS